MISLDNKMILVCPNCKATQTPVFHKEKDRNGVLLDILWDNQCFYCRYVFPPKMLTG